MRDYLIVAFVVGSLPVGLFRPYYGLLVYAWISYMNPHLWAWSFAQTFPVAKLSALSALGGSALAGAASPAPLRYRENVMMLLLWGMFTMSTIFAIYPAQAWAKWQDVSKLILMGLLTSMLLRDRQRVRLFLLVVAFSLGIYGFKGGLFSILTGGKYMVQGPGDSIIGANNNIGLAFVASVPLCWYLANEERGWLRLALRATALLTVPAIMFTYSRASVMALAVVLAAIFIKSRYRVPLITGAVILAVLAIPYIPEKWWNRQQTVFTYEQDPSAMSRIDNWKFCWRMAMDRPLTGAGFSYMTREVFQKYAPEFLHTYGGKVWDTHSIYLAMLASHGFPGLIIFCTMIAMCFLSCAHMKRAVRRRSDLGWIATYSTLIQLSLLGYLINGAFVNMEYFDLLYDWVAVVVSLRMICRRELASEETEEPLTWSAPVLAT
jgi:putative inorganic carbon (HCO3(-)) transporter